jgi:prepilin-type N-terminal cleavage/methylation domain-containing protein
MNCPSTNQPSADTMRVRAPFAAASGFTITEMLIVVALLAVLISLVLVSVSHFRLSALRTDTTNALRQMVGGYSAYMNDNNQRIMPGYLDADDQNNFVQQLRLNADRPDEERFITDFDDDDQPYADLSSYVWRLAPYLDFHWRTPFTDYRNNHTMDRLDRDLQSAWYGPASYQGPLDQGDDVTMRALSMIPSIGLNSIFLGGDTRHGGALANGLHPWHPNVVDGTRTRIAATRYTEVRNPSRIIVFAPVSRASTASFDELNPEATYHRPNWADHAIGYPELRPPFVARNNSGVWMSQHRQWAVGRNEQIVRRDTGEYGNGAGLPIMRWGAGKLPVAHLDGSATVEDIGPLSADMRRWAPDEAGTVLPAVELD